MVRQHDNRIDRKGVLLPDPAKDGPQQADIREEQAAPPIGQIDRKEISTSGDKAAAIAGHM